MAMSVSGVTSPSMLKAVRASRTATLNEVHPRYASFPMRLARLSPTRCQNSTTPSAPAFSIMSSIRDARATSITRSPRPCASHERAQDLLESRPPLLLRLRGDSVPFEFPQADDDGCLEDVREDPLHLRDFDGLRRQEDEERSVPDARNDDRASLELLDRHHHVLPAQLVADVRQVALQEVQ